MGIQRKGVYNWIQLTGGLTLKFFNTLRYERNLFFAALGMRRFNRILACTFVIACIWCFADFRSGNLKANYIDDIICLGLGVIAERLIPWGKPPTIEAVTPENG
jgi:hypothetical protein